MSRSAAAAEKYAKELADHVNPEIIERVARALHAGESMYMHEDISVREPCRYCWYRAGRAVLATIPREETQ